MRTRSTKAQLEAIDSAIVEAVRADAPVTLRGVFYRVASMGAVEKTEEGYKLTGRQLLKLRRSGRVSYGDITDGSRTVFRPQSFTGIDQVLNDAPASYRKALWHDQGTEVHIYSEKDAISGVVYPVTAEFDVPFGVVRGYSSETLAWQAASAIELAGEAEKNVVVYQLGDHDPSGVDAWRSFSQRVVSFLNDAERVRAPVVDGEGGAMYRYLPDTSLIYSKVAFIRLAVTPQQIDSMNLPTRPTKSSDSRAAKFSGESVEVDAIPATELRRIVRQAIERHIDPDALRLLRAAERSELEVLARMSRDADNLIFSYSTVS